MEDEIVALLQGGPPIRPWPEPDLQNARYFLRSRIEPILKTTARRHPLGFIYATEAISDGTSLRYHIWPKAWHVPEDQAGSEIHDHIYELNSLVLGGVLRHETFEAVPKLDGAYELLEVTYSKDRSLPELTGTRVDLRSLTDEIHMAGTAYRLLPGIIHRASAVRTPAVTMVLTIDKLPKLAPRVVVGVGYETPSSFDRRPLMHAEIVEALEVLESL
ncbi:MAG: hypothetical protein MUC44_13065 [Beijerinckiaceae bacterium]|nr:hypothetical protein [Beijerinckiaceae bacterium]